MRWRAGRLAWLVPLAVVACDGAPPERRVPSMPPVDGEVAVVASERIDGETVRAIAAAQQTSLAVARDRAIRDALFAVEARSRGRAPRAAESAVLARALLEERRRELDGPVTDEELAAVTRLHWLELDRPEAFRTVHAVVLVKKKSTNAPPPSESEWQQAEAVAKAVAEASTAASDAARLDAGSDAAVVAALQEAVKGVDKRGMETKVESLDPTTADGRVVSPRGGQFAPDFGAAVAKLGARGDVTPPFRTPFGVHVALLLERSPAVSVPLEERRALVRDEVVDGRLAKDRKALTATLAPTVELATNAAALLDLVSVAAADASAPGSP